MGTTICTAGERRINRMTREREKEKEKFKMAVDTLNRADSLTLIEREHYATGYVTSKDGTTLGYRQYGQPSHGPGVVLLHGAMESAQSHEQLAQALDDAFTVFVPDRRGRGLSGPY